MNRLSNIGIINGIDLDQAVYLLIHFDFEWIIFIVESLEKELGIKFRDPKKREYIDDYSIDLCEWVKDWIQKNADVSSFEKKIAFIKKVFHQEKSIIEYLREILNNVPCEHLPDLISRLEQLFEFSFLPWESGISQKDYISNLLFEFDKQLKEEFQKGNFSKLFGKSLNIDVKQRTN